MAKKAAKGAKKKAAKKNEVDWLYRPGRGANLVEDDPPPPPNKTVRKMRRRAR